MIGLLLSLAIVTQDQIPLRAAPGEHAARHAVLAQGDNLEVRGVKGDYLQVFDHRRARAGYVRATQVGLYDLTPREAPRLRAVLEFLKDQPGQEALGIGHAAAFFKAAPAGAIDAGAFEALGKIADRLAWRVSRLSGTDSEAARTVSAHLDAAASYGVQFHSVERYEKVTLCYDGDAWRRVLSLPASPEQKARAALSLTRHDCVKATLSPSERLDADHARAEMLDLVLTEGESRGGLPEHLRNRLKIRAAGVWASVAHRRAHRPDSDPAAVLEAGRNAETHLASVDKNALVDGDRAAWNEAAIRVGASRWAAQAQTLVQPAQGRPGIQISAGDEPGQHCVHVVAAQKTGAGAGAGEAAASQESAQGKAFTHCTYGQVWPCSLAVSPDSKVMTLAVQPLENWRELWVFRQMQNGWQLDIVPPSVDNPELGYIEFAGWVPGNKQFLVAREVVGNGHKTSFELWDRATLKVEKRADKPDNLSAFYRWQDPVWKGGTVAVR
ncbi:MAG: hypothetical protein LBS49_01695 [Candidatus Accumulibacter sp.]|jgi:hypothetical protein|nr:hypothetical protein [Accumulibacter sp.]